MRGTEGLGGMTDRARFVVPAKEGRAPSALQVCGVGCQEGQEQNEASLDDARQGESDESHINGTPPIASVSDEDEDGEQHGLSDEEHLDEPQWVTPGQCARISHPYEQGI